MDELMDVYTRDGKYIGVKLRSECHSENPGFYHKPVWIWIINDDNKILVQKRASIKKSFPNYWDTPSAGHVKSGETSIKGAIRETKEELGIDTSEKDYEFVCEYISDTTWELGQVYIIKINIELNDIILQEDEVDEVKWLSLAEFKELLYSEKFIPYDLEYKNMVFGFLKKKLGERYE